MQPLWDLETHCRSARLLRTLAVGAAAAALSLACSGEIDTPNEGNGGAGASTAAGGSGSGAAPAGSPDLPSPSPRVARLTHLQWERTIHDLFEAAPGTFEQAASFRSDPAQQGFLFDNDATALSVDEVLWKSYQRAAADVAARVTGDRAMLERLLPAGDADEAQARAFVVEFGRRVHRRPLTEEQTEEYLDLYRAAPGVYTGMSDFDGGIRLLIEAFLQSPHFVYRIESSADAAGDVIPLDGYEVASRLSYMLWNTMPDEALLGAAAAGDLLRTDGLAEHARRLLDDPRAEETILHFHEQLLELERYAAIQPSSTFYPDAPAELGALAARETELFVKDLVLDADAGLGALLTSTRSFVNQDLASLYGLSGDYGDEFVPVELDPAERRGLLTQVGFLAAHATSVDPDPIHRGVFVAKRVLCAPLGVPPGEIPPLPAPEGRTNRETVAQHTETPGTSCANCHATLINPLGFPFESYDAVGAYRTEDNGHPVDTAAEPLIGAEPVAVEDALELATALAASPQVHECYAKHWLEFAYGRARSKNDAGLIERLGARSAAEDLSIKDLIVALVTTQAFTTRSVEELP